MTTLIIDNYDSYTYNLYQLFAKVEGEEPLVIKNDQMDFESLKKLAFDKLVISPGPGSPENDKDFGLSKRAIEELDLPIFGVCLGQQGIYMLSGGKVGQAEKPMHGILSEIYHKEKGIFEGIKQGIKVTRYHSLVCKKPVPQDIEIEAWTEDHIIMAISHKKKPIWAVQFHPESILTEYGQKMVENFLNMAEDYNKKRHKISYKCLDKKIGDLEIYKLLKKYDPKIIWLDSSKHEEGLARFSYYGLSSLDGGYHLRYNQAEKKVTKISYKGEIEEFSATIFDYLKENPLAYENFEELEFDFQLGYMGYFGYELKGDLIVENKHKSSYPDSYLKYVDRLLVLDHKEEKIYLMAFKGDAWLEEVESLLKRDFPLSERPREKRKKDEKISLSLALDKTGYLTKIEKIHQLIKEGETYEICLTNRLDIEGEIDADSYYERLRELSPGPYSCLLNFDQIKIASSSMEKFISLDRDRNIYSKPIKGTVKRGKSLEEDQILIDFLKTDVKTLAENLMIVDLLRNDFGRVSQIGTVEVPKLMDVETYKTVHQLVTTVKGKLKEDKNIIDLLEVTFPGGSMTGAPKKRSLEIIDCLEEYPRGIYSGTIGYISKNESADFNIVIRTMVIEEDKASLGIGGAITYLSDPEEEFQEILLKAKGALGAYKEYMGLEKDAEIYIEGSK